MATSKCNFPHCPGYPPNLLEPCVHCNNISFHHLCHTSYEFNNNYDFPMTKKCYSCLSVTIEEYNKEKKKGKDRHHSKKSHYNYEGNHHYHNERKFDTEGFRTFKITFSFFEDQNHLRTLWILLCISQAWCSLRWWPLILNSWRWQYLEVCGKLAEVLVHQLRYSPREVLPRYLYPFSRRQSHVTTLPQPEDRRLRPSAHQA